VIPFRRGPVRGRLRRALALFSCSAASLAMSIAPMSMPIVAAVAVVSSPSVAEAQSAEVDAVVTANAEILVLHATQRPGAGTIDPSIGELPQLKNPPFNSYNTYKLLARKGVSLRKGVPTDYVLADGRKLELTLLDRVAGKPARYRLAASIGAPKGEAFLKKIEVTASPNEPFFVAGQSHKGGILVLGIAIRE